MEEYTFPDEKAAVAAAVESGGDNAVGIDPIAPAPDIEVEAVDDTPAKDVGRKPLKDPVAEVTDDEMASYGEKVQKRIKELTHARHDERRAKEAVERRHAELETMTRNLLDENQQLRGYVDTGSKQYVDQAALLAASAVEKAKRELRAAQEAFDTDGIINAQEALTDAKIREREAKQMRPTALQNEKTVVNSPQQATETKLDPRTQQWMDENKWFGSTDHEDVTAFVLGLDKKLVRAGYSEGSEAYFEQIDARVKKVFPELSGGETLDEQERVSSKAKPTPKPAASIVAPATRSSGVKKVQLTTTQIALANKLGITPQQYAAQVVALQESSNG